MRLSSPNSNHVDDLQKDLEIQFCDLEFLYNNCLDDKGKALNYFYTSVFYEAGCLNDLILNGQDIGVHDEGCIYEVVDDNIDVIKLKSPMDQAARHIFFNENVIFVIKKIRRKLVMGNIRCTPEKVFFIVQGKIYRMSTFASILRFRIYNSLLHLEKCFDTMHKMSSWSLTEGHTWRSILPEEQQKYLDFLTDNFSKNDEVCKLNRRLKSKRVKDFDHSDDLQKERKKYETSDSSDGEASHHSNVQVQFSKPTSDLAMRMCLTEIKSLHDKSNELDEEHEKFLQLHENLLKLENISDDASKY